MVLLPVANRYGSRCLLSGSTQLTRQILFIGCGLLCCPFAGLSQQGIPGTQNQPTVIGGLALQIPESVTNQVEIGDTALRTGHYDFALNAYRKALEGVDQASKSAGFVYARIGEAYRRKGDIALSLTNLRKAKDLHPGNPTVLILLATALNQKGDHAAATTELKAALKSSPSKEEEQRIRQLLGSAGAQK
jgi:tetratricopeptide (TPR) repeat protein